MPDRKETVRADVDAANRELLQMVDAFGPQDWERAANEGWSAKDMFAHLCTIQKRQRDQIQCALDGTPWDPPDDVNVYNERLVNERKDWTIAQLREELVRESTQTLALIDGLREEDMARTYQHPTRGQRSIDEVGQQVANHLRGHAREMAGSRD
jgi:hypothetical protein